MIRCADSGYDVQEVTDVQSPEMANKRPQWVATSSFLLHNFPPDDCSASQGCLDFAVAAGGFPVVSCANSSGKVD